RLHAGRDRNHASARRGEAGHGNTFRHQSVSRSRARGRRRAGVVLELEDPGVGGRHTMSRRFVAQPCATFGFRGFVFSWLLLAAVVSGQTTKTHELPLKPESVHWGYY